MASPQRREGTTRSRKVKNSHSGAASGLKKKEGLLAKDPKPFRGARTSSFSLSSIVPNDASEDEASTGPDNGSGEQDVDEMEIGSRASQGQQQEANGDMDISFGHSASGDDLQGRQEIFEFMMETMPNLLKAAQDLVDSLNTSDGSLRKSWELKVKRKALDAHLEPFQTSSDEPALVDWAPLEEWRRTNLHASPSVSCLARVNVALALYDCYVLEHDSKATRVLPRRFLEELDRSFPTRFTRAELSQPPYQLALDIRTCHLIESLSTLQGNSKDALRTMAAMFCEAGFRDDNFSKVFAEGPFRSIAGRHGGDIEALCSERLTEIYRRVRRNQNFGVPELRQDFPLNELLATLRLWLLNEFWKPVEETSASASSAFEEFLLTYDDDDSSSDEESDSQEIVRLDNSEERPSLFVGIESIKQLELSKHHDTSPQPGYGPKQLRIPSSREILLAPTPPVRQVGSRVASKVVRQHNAEQDGLINESEPSVAGANSSQRDDGPTVSRKAGNRAHKPARSHHSETNQGSDVSLTSDHSDAPDLHLPRRPGGGRIRWSEHDENLLIKLIGKYGAQWTEIERHRGKFDTQRRGSLAYRDKARTIKLSLLSNDSLLPPRFDEVRFNKSQVQRLQTMGKNAFREERDVQDGLPIKTLHLPVP
ncbi:hypothetical protein CDD81_5748 [Ophiocordyceps australis]|uniref:Myb-like domain-containing protein n=1 Tax=Ophiocordyceps australis TaxID=1399860 RepID=A0A2C5Y9K7_9HYPO|nr:hypothetical protein CDD81_5748 [Ophiocordyceps australis]